MQCWYRGIQLMNYGEVRLKITRNLNIFIFLAKTNISYGRFWQSQRIDNQGQR